MIKKLDNFSNGLTANESLNSHSNTNYLLEIVQKAFKVQKLVDDYKSEIAKLNDQIKLADKRIVELESELAHSHEKYFQFTKEVITDKEWNDACAGLGRVGC